MRIKRSLLIISLLIACCTLAGCASLFGDSTQTINLGSKPEGANVSIYNKRGKKVFAGKTPTVVTLRKKDRFFEGEDYVVRFKLPKYQSHTVYLNRGYSGWYLANILNLFGLFLIDPLTGAMWSYSPDMLRPTLELETPDIID